MRRQWEGGKWGRRRSGRPSVVEAGGGGRSGRRTRWCGVPEAAFPGMAESPAAEEAPAPAAVLAAPGSGSASPPSGGTASPGVFIPAELWAAAGFGAATPSGGGGGGGGPGSGGAPIAAAAAAAGAALLTHSAFWDPTVSGDWDSERPSAACLLRIKR